MAQIFFVFKGKLISKGTVFWCLQIYQKANEIFVRISALAPKMGQTQFDQFLRLGQKSLKKFRWLLVDLKTTKISFEIN